MPPKSGWAHCASCHESFTSDTAFDEHRVGAFGVDRRCLTPDEMSDSGILRDRRGYWMSSRGSDPETLRNYWAERERASQEERGDL